MNRGSRPEAAHRGGGVTALSPPPRPDVLAEAEAVIAKWDQKAESVGHMTYRELARALFDVYHPGG
jgi:hypothetical protein